MVKTTILDDEREKLAELIAIKVAEKYLVIVKEHVGREIALHKYQCAAGKWSWFNSLLSAVLGGVITGLVVGVLLSFMK